MTNNNRQIEIKKSITAFSKDAYYNDELLDELFLFQRQVVNVTFEETHAEKMNLKMYDVQKHLHEKNQELSEVIKDKLPQFDEYCEVFNAMIGRKIAGQKGETQLFRTLQTLENDAVFLRNVELKSGDSKAELDAVVITSKAIFLIEVKNPSHDMIIDSRGNYFRAYGYMNLDYNIGEKISSKEHLLKKAILDSELHEDIKAIPIVNLVVFANSKMKCENRFKYVDVCHLSNLPFIIKGYQGDSIITNDEMHAVGETIEAAETKEAYPVKLDFESFKATIAEIIAELEAEVEKTESEDSEHEEPRTYKPDVAKRCSLGVAGTIACFAAGALTGYAYKRLVKGK